MGNFFVYIDKSCEFCTNFYHTNILIKLKLMKLNLRKMMAVVMTAVVALGASAQNLYIFGSFNGWDPANSIEMWNDNGVYTIEDIEFGAGGNFAVSTVQSSNWDAVNAARYGFSQDNAIATEGKAMKIVKGTGAMQVPAAGVYNIYVNLSAMTVTVKKAGEVVIETPKNLYVMGNLSVGSWDPATAVELEKIDDYNFSGQVTFSGAGDGYSYFAIAGAKGTWEAVNPARFAPKAGEVAFNIDENVEFVKGEAAFKVKAEGTYYVNVDFKNLTVNVSNFATGVEGIEADVNVVPVYYNLQGVEVANPQNGLYIVKQGNKVSKQLIK